MDELWTPYFPFLIFNFKHCGITFIATSHLHSKFIHFQIDQIKYTAADPVTTQYTAYLLLLAEELRIRNDRLQSYVSQGQDKIHILYGGVKSMPVLIKRRAEGAASRDKFKKSALSGAKRPSVEATRQCIICINDTAACELTSLF